MSALITNANAKFMFAQNEIMLNAFLTLCAPQKVQKVKKSGRGKQREREKERSRERRASRSVKISWETDLSVPNSFACGKWQGCPRNGSIKIIAERPKEFHFNQMKLSKIVNVDQ